MLLSMDPEKTAPEKQSKSLAVPIDKGDGVIINKAEINYTYWDNAGYTMHYKQGVSVYVPYSEATLIAISVLENAALALLGS